MQPGDQVPSAEVLVRVCAAADGLVHGSAFRCDAKLAHGWEPLQAAHYRPVGVREVPCRYPGGSGGVTGARGEAPWLDEVGRER